MAILEEEVATGRDAPGAGMVGRAGWAAVLGHDPLDARMKDVGRVGTVALKPVDDDRRRRKFATKLLPAVPCTEAVGIAVPGPVDPSRQGEVTDEDRPADIGRIAPGVGLTVPPIGWAEENMVGRLSVVARPGAWLFIRHLSVKFFAFRPSQLRPVPSVLSGKRSSLSLA